MTDMGGVAVLIRKSLLTSGAVRVVEDRVRRAEAGRLIAVPRRSFWCWWLRVLMDR